MRASLYSVVLISGSSTIPVSRRVFRLQCMMTNEKTANRAEIYNGFYGQAGWCRNVIYLPKCTWLRWWVRRWFDAWWCRKCRAERPMPVKWRTPWHTRSINCASLGRITPEKINNNVIMDWNQPYTHSSNIYVSRKKEKENEKRAKKRRKDGVLWILISRLRSLHHLLPILYDFTNVCDTR